MSGKVIEQGFRRVVPGMRGASLQIGAPSSNRKGQVRAGQFQPEFQSSRSFSFIRKVGGFTVFTVGG